MWLVIVLTLIVVIPLIIRKLLLIQEGVQRERTRQSRAYADRAPYPTVPRRVSAPEGEPNARLILLIQKLPLIMQVLITLIGLVGGGYIVVSGKYPADIQKWATGIIGLVIGFWLK